jgi:hypothetical protein
MQQCTRFRDVSLAASRAEKAMLASTRQHLRTLERQRKALESAHTTAGPEGEEGDVGLVEDRRKAGPVPSRPVLPPFPSLTEAQAEIQALEEKVAHTASVAEEQAQGVIEIERGVNKISEIMTEIAVMVDQQGEDLETFDATVGKAADNVEDGVSDLRVAERRQMKAHKKTCFLFGLVAVIAIVVVLLITLNVVSFV